MGSVKEHWEIVSKLLNMKSIVREKSSHPSHLVTIASIIRNFCPSVAFRGKKKIVDCDRAFRIGYKKQNKKQKTQKNPQILFVVFL